MEKPSFPAFRSASMPNASLQVHPAPLQTVNPQQSPVMFTGGPITPPLSPGNSEHEEVPPSHVVQTTQGASSPARLSSASHGAAEEIPRADDSMDVDQVAPEPVNPPVRHLEDEQSHVHRGGSLRLTDFEVKGTLGESCSSCRRGRCSDRPCNS